MSENKGVELLTVFLDPSGTAEFPAYQAFSDVSVTFLRNYEDLVAEGLPPQSVATAMLVATVNFYRLFGMSAELPGLLRAVADSVQVGAD